MKYYSTNHRTEPVSLETAVTLGIADDGGLFMPEDIAHLPKAFFANIRHMSLTDISFAVANYALRGDFDSKVLHDIINETLNFPIPLVEVSANRYVLELFHGPTMGFKDIGARFMGRLLSRFMVDKGQEINVIVATSGNSGGAVAQGFHNLPGVKAFILYPQGAMSKLQEAQFTTVGDNITAIEINGSLDDCHRLSLQALSDPDIARAMNVTSAKTYNIARLLPQMFYYFHAYARLQEALKSTDVQPVIAVPCGHLGNLTAGAMAQAMGLPVKRFLAVNNRNDTFRRFLMNGRLEPHPKQHTIANAIDTANPRNLPRLLELYHGDISKMKQNIDGYAFSDDEIVETIAQTCALSGYQLDPHGALAFRALEENLKHDEPGIALETAHPAKFAAQIQEITGESVEIPSRMLEVMNREKKIVKLGNGFNALKRFLLDEK